MSPSFLTRRGNGEDGKLGYGDQANVSVPTNRRVALPAGVVVASVSAGWSHTCVVTRDKKLLCFG